MPYLSHSQSLALATTRNVALEQGDLEPPPGGSLRVRGRHVKIFRFEFSARSVPHASSTPNPTPSPLPFWSWVWSGGSTYSAPGSSASEASSLAAAAACPIERTFRPRRQKNLLYFKALEYFVHPFEF
eukprot:GHVU01025226.1.p2 GENE.GHVU01025226.1~~GHVU01025226.1.p2  ORF type:complete len:128 (-),score=3.24 GHVU01025226.1:137-520(-)